MTVDNGSEYAVLAEQVAREARADLIEPIRLALLAVAEQRNGHWRQYVHAHWRGYAEGREPASGLVTRLGQGL